MSSSTASATVTVMGGMWVTSTRGIGLGALAFMNAALRSSGTTFSSRSGTIIEK